MCINYKKSIKHSDLVFYEGVNQDTIDIAGDEAKSQNDHIFGQDAGKVLITKTT